MGKVLTIGEPLVLFGAIGEENLNKKIADVDKFQRYLAGAEINVCVALKRLGHDVHYITNVGDDPFGEFIMKQLDTEGIGTTYIKKTTQYFTGFQYKTAVTHGDPSIFYFRKNSAASHYSVENIEELNINLQEIDAIHVTGIFLALSETTRMVVYHLIEQARKYGVRIFMDPNLRVQLWDNERVMIEEINKMASLCDVVMPGLEEGFLLTGSRNPESIADFYLHRGVEMVVVKTGAEGAYVKTAQMHHNVEGFKVSHIVDTIGAGDGFAAGLISAYLEQQTIEDSLRQANAIGAFAIQCAGDNEGYPTREELTKFLNNNKKGII